MGAVKDAVSGPGPAEKKPGMGDGNLIAQSRALADELSSCAAIKDEDALKEGEAAKTENMRKAALLRAAFSLQKAVEKILEEYNAASAR